VKKDNLHVVTTISKRDFVFIYSKFSHNDRQFDNTAFIPSFPTDNIFKVKSMRKDR